MGCALKLNVMSKCLMENHVQKPKEPMGGQHFHI